jgi:dTDP-glucose pyrophosphorylase
MRGFLVAEGTVTKPRPVTKVVAKQLMPRLSNLLVFSPLRISMLSGSRNIVTVINQENQLNFKKLFGNRCQ